MAPKKEKTTSLPLAPQADGLSSYLRAVKSFPVLTEAEEKELAEKFYRTGDVKAAEKLVTSHLRLVVKVAYTYRYYGLPMNDIIAEGSVGLMKAVKKFEPDKGFRLSTYAVWWIKASINEYILNSWSLVKMGTVADQKKLFFRLGQLKNKLGIYDNSSMTAEASKLIASDLGVSENEVISMNARLSGDSSLNTVLSEDGMTEKIDMLADNRPNQEERFSSAEEKAEGIDLIKRGLGALNEREREIIRARRLTYTPATLEELSEKFGISRERVRQIEARAFEKMQKAIIDAKLALNAPLAETKLLDHKK